MAAPQMCIHRISRAIRGHHVAAKLQRDLAPFGEAGEILRSRSDEPCLRGTILESI